MDVADLRVKFSADGVQETTAQMEQVDSRISQFGETASKVGGKMRTYLTLPILGIGAASFIAASNTEENINKVNVVFGSSAPIITAWASNAATQLGISNAAALGAAGTFGNLFLNMGMTQDAAATMSQQVVTLASDLASFNNTSPEQALVAIQAALIGESEPIRQFGVNLTEATLKAEAFRLGLYNGEGQLNSSARSQAALSLIIQQTTTAQGDFARTADGTANSMRIARAQFADAAAVLGTQLLPAGTKVVQMLGDMAVKFQGMSPEMQKAVTIGAAAVAVLGPLAIVIGFVVTNATALGAALGTVIAPLTGAMAVFVLFGPVLVPISAALGLIKTNFLGIGTAIKGVATDVSDAATWLADAGTNLITGFADAIDTAVTDILSPSLVAIYTLIPLLFSTSKDWISSAGTDLITGFSGAIDIARAEVLSVSLTGVISTITGAFGDAGSWLWNAGYNIIWGLVQGIENAASGILQGALDKVTGLIPSWKGPESRDRALLQPTGGFIMQGLVTGIEQSIPALRASLSHVTNLIGGANVRGSLGLPAQPSFSPALARATNGPASVNHYYIIERGSFVGPGAVQEIHRMVQSGQARIVDGRISSRRIEEMR